MREVDLQKLREIFLMVLITVLLLPYVVVLVERAPWISEKEIIESLATLKDGQKNLEKRYRSLRGT